MAWRILPESLHVPQVENPLWLADLIVYTIILRSALRLDICIDLLCITL